jgi:PASTA domain/Regulator of chromosome condensation (RCC1) repeat
MLRLRFCLLALVLGSLVAPLPAAAGGAPGSVIAWGCGGGLDSGQCTVPAAAQSGVVAIAAGSSHSLALKRDGSVVAWGCAGEDDRGQCSVPPAATSGVVAIEGGIHHSLALKRDGSVVAWGCGINFGQCDVPADATSGVKAIAAGWHSLALKDGRVIAWGCTIGDYGQCAVPAAAQSGVTAIAAGSSHSLALKQDGSVVAWGCRPPNDFGQCSVPAAASSGVIAIAAADYHNLALKQDGSVIAWGCRSNGSFTPNFGQCAVPGAAASGVKAIAVGYSHSLALKQNGSVIAWGCDIGLDVGNCTVPAAAGDGVGAIAADARQSLALFPLLPQTIAVTGHAPAAATYKQTFSVAATSSSGLPVAFTSGGACSNAGATFTMTSGTGTCLVRYDQPGDGPYDAAPQVVESVTARKAAQTIAFAPLPRRTYGDPDFRVVARASSGLGVAFAARGRCRVSGARVHLTGAGSCTVTASQPGDANYDAAPPVSRTFSIARAPCTVPNVVGKPLAAAKRAIKRRHCRTGKVSNASSSRGRKGVVVSQSRRPGRVLPAGSKIDLVVGRGRRP